MLEFLNEKILTSIIRNIELLQLLMLFAVISALCLGCRVQRPVREWEAPHKTCNYSCVMYYAAELENNEVIYRVITIHCLREQVYLSAPSSPLGGQTRESWKTNNHQLLQSLTSQATESGVVKRDNVVSDAQKVNSSFSSLYFLIWISLPM